MGERLKDGLVKRVSGSPWSLSLLGNGPGSCRVCHCAPCPPSSVFHYSSQMKNSQARPRWPSPGSTLIISSPSANSLQPGHPGSGQPKRPENRGHLRYSPEDRDWVLSHQAGGSGMLLWTGGNGRLGVASSNKGHTWALGFNSSRIDLLDEPGTFFCLPISLSIHWE